MLSKTLRIDPWRLLWRIPYTQLLQFQHVALRCEGAWTVPPYLPEPPVSADDFDALLSP